MVFNKNKMSIYDMFSNQKQIDSQSFYNVFLNFLMKWSAREYVTDTEQKSLEQTADMRLVRRDVRNVKYSSIGKENIVLAVDMFLEQNPKERKPDIG